jgi:hypothetical protein
MVSQAQSVVVGGLIFVGLVACGGAPRVPPAPPLAREAVDLTLPSVDGAEVDFVRWRGKHVVVHFASTSSLDSQADVEELRRTRDAARDLVLVEIVVDQGAPGGARLAAPWADASRIDWSVLLPTPEVTGGSSTFGAIRVVPTTFLMGRDGHLVWRWEGALPKGRLRSALQERSRRQKTP